MIHWFLFSMWSQYTDYAIPVQCAAVYSKLCRLDVLWVFVLQCRIEVQKCGVKVVVVRPVGLRVSGFGL
jgi:hypothetical protein